MRRYRPPHRRKRLAVPEWRGGRVGKFVHRTHSADRARGQVERKRNASGMRWVRVTVEGRTVSHMLDREQRAAHGLAWLATYVQALRQLAAYASRARAAGRLGETEDLIVRIGVAEYFAQILGGIPMSQGEIVRLADLGLGAAKVAARVPSSFAEAVAVGNSAQNR